jgi:hypothetical protein
MYQKLPLYIFVAYIYHSTVIFAIQANDMTPKQLGGTHLSVLRWQKKAIC